MPRLIAYRMGPNPLPATQGRIDVLTLKNYGIPIAGSRVLPDVVDFANVTELLGLTVLGTRAAKKYRVRPDGCMVIWLVSDVNDHLYGPIKLEVTVSEKVPPDYIELGWAVLEGHFEIGPEDDQGIITLDARDPSRCKTRQLIVTSSPA